ncbi:ERAD-associated protein [Mortierella alpina]|nr:ERAD-associated protein [Mortierella alpina]
MARRKRVVLTCTVLFAVILLVRASDPSAASGGTEKLGSGVGVEMLQEDPHKQDKTEEGKKAFQQAMQLLDSSPVKSHERVFFRQKSSLARTFLSDELQKQKGLLPAALRLVTQGIVSLFKSTPSSTTAPPPSSAKEDTQDAQDEQLGFTPMTKPSQSKHRDPNIAKAMELLELAGYDYENDDALWTLANIYFHGQYKARRDLGQAFDMYAALADRSGNSTAQHMVGFMYSTGLGNVVERDEAKAMLYTTFAAWMNNSPAALTLGYKYMLGIGTKKSCKESELYYKRAADKAYNHFMDGPPLGRTMPPAKIRLTDEDGGAYGAGASGPGAAQGQGQPTVIKDYIDYTRYLAEGDSQDGLDAKLSLGVIYYTGNAGARTTVPRDYQQAGTYLKSVANAFFTPKMNAEAYILKATNLRNAENAGNAGIAAALLGKMHWRGEGFEVDEKQALDWFKKGSLLNNPVAINGLGMMHLKGAAGLTPNPTKATEYFKTAADLKFSDAQVNIALIYAQDPKFHTAAFNYLLEAAHQQNFQAVYHLGEAYSHGLLGVAKNCEKASRYFKYVAERGDWDDTLFSDAYESYRAGDVEYAAILYLLAAERGIEVGQSNFAWILDRELPTSHYLTKLTSPSRTALDAISQSALVSLASPSRLLQMALVYWTRSANQGDVDARVKMGDYYFSGIGTDVDFGKATACYRVAAEAERSAMAMWNLGWMHENGVGVPKDFYLAKRWYDRSLTTNPGAVMPVTLSLVKWHARYIWNYLTGGDIGGSPDSFWSFGSKSSDSDSASSSSSSSERGTEDEAKRENNPRGGNADNNDGSSLDELTSGSEGGSSSSSRSEWDPEEINRIGLEKWKHQRQTGPGQEDEFDEADPFQQQHHHHNRQQQQEEDDMEDDLVEGLVIIGLCMVVGYLMYVRQFRFGNQGQQPNQHQNQDQNNQDHNNPQQPQPPVEGMPGDPNAPGRFAYYAAGG